MTVHLPFSLESWTSSSSLDFLPTCSFWHKLNYTTPDIWSCLASCVVNKSKWRVAHFNSWCCGEHVSKFTSGSLDVKTFVVTICLSLLFLHRNTQKSTWESHHKWRLCILKSDHHDHGPMQVYWHWSKMLHPDNPSNIISGLFLNASAKEWLKDCVLCIKKLCLGMGTISWECKFPIFLWTGMKACTIYFTKRCCDVWCNGDPSGFINDVNTENKMVQFDLDDKEISPTIFHPRNWAEDIAMVCNQGFVVDDNNEAHSWKHQCTPWCWELRTCTLGRSGGLRTKWTQSNSMNPESASFIGNFEVKDAAWLEIILRLFPTEWLRHIVLVEMKKKLSTLIVLVSKKNTLAAGFWLHLLMEYSIRRATGLVMSSMNDIGLVLTIFEPTYHLSASKRPPLHWPSQTLPK